MTERHSALAARSIALRGALTGTHRTYRRFLPTALVGTGIIVFLIGSGIAAAYFYSSGANLREGVISRLESPMENPHGYLAASCAIAICGVLMLPVAPILFFELREGSAVLSGIGSLLLVLGFTGEIGLGCLARLWGMYDDFHIGLAFGTFITMSAGLTICLGLAARLRRNRAVAPPVPVFALWLLAGIHLVAVSILTYMLFHPNFPPERSFFTSLAFLEWTLCAIFMVSLLTLTVSVTAGVQSYALPTTKTQGDTAP